MSKYESLIKSRPVISFKKDCTDVIFTVISCMCDNKYTLRMKKNSDGEFKLNGMSQCLGNFQFKNDVHEIEWKADEGKWADVVRMINKGTVVIESVASR